MRERLKSPFGELYRCSGEECLRGILKGFKSPPKVISIGDMTTYFMLKSGRVPDMCIVDDLTMRLPVDIEVRRGTAHESFIDVRVKNPAGIVTEELIGAIRDNMRSGRPVRIYVEGEEDLAVIPACVYAPAGSVILYGQPGEGVVAVKVTEDKKHEARSLLEQMIME